MGLSSHTKGGKPGRAGKQHSPAPDPGSSTPLLCMQNHGVCPGLLRLSCFTALPAASALIQFFHSFSTISFWILPHLSPLTQPNYCNELSAFAISTSLPPNLTWLPPHLSIGTFLFSSDDHLLLSPYSAGCWICQSTSRFFGLNGFLKGNFVLKYIIRMLKLARPVWLSG